VCASAAEAALERFAGGDGYRIPGLLLRGGEVRSAVVLVENEMRIVGEDVGATQWLGNKWLTHTLSGPLR
jgi:hypothetical protein